MYVTSPRRRWFGRRASNRRRKRAADTRALRESVVIPKRRTLRGAICAWRISLATILRQHATPCACTSVEAVLHGDSRAK
jgi:hypothetical protein